MVDIGGGSTEFVLGAGHAQQAVSVDMGCVRFTERHLHGNPPGPEEIAGMVAEADALIERAAASVDLQRAACLVGLAGTVTTMSALAMGLPAYDSSAIHGSVMTAAQVHAVAGRLAAATRQERAAMPVMHPGRADVIAAGAIILDRIVAAVGRCRGHRQRARHPRRNRLVPGVPVALGGAAATVAACLPTQ